MRHSRVVQSYNYAAPSLEVTEAELLNRRVPKGWTCQTVAQLGIPHADSPKTVEEQAPEKPKRNCIVRRSSHSIADAHRLTIHRNVTRRMQAAKERGDEKLLRALEAELREMISA
ncbi:hypothetical protein ACQ4M3_31070 [Leptolyngbya sp. AN03gr2]|uniref:hypothetical protein n=1 Tax=unclassified Leptolyngbya TaxID=2650499 RepID=UPI003D318ECD